MTSPAFSELIKDLQQEMGTVTEIKDSNRASPFKDHLNMVAEGMRAHMKRSGSSQATPC